MPIADKRADQRTAGGRDAGAEPGPEPDRARQLFEANPLPTWVFDVETLQFLEVNDAAVRHYGYSRDEFLAMKISDIRPAEDVPDLINHLEHLPARTEHALWRHRKKDGSIIFVELSGHELELDGRRARLIVSQDVTERRLAEARLHSSEEQLRQSQKMEAVGLLAGGVAHDFNNMITVVLTYSDFVLAELGADHPSRADVEEIRRAGQRASGLTSQLLAFSRRQVMEPSILDLNTVIDDMDRMLRRLIGEDVELKTMPGSDLGRVKADRAHLEQVVLNLVINARDAMPEGGTVIVETGNVLFGEDEASQKLGVPPGRHVMLAVTDTGCGMDAETQARIFEPFFTTKPPGKGTGLGLSTVYGIVQQSGGTIWVYSEPGKGTTFKILLPPFEEVTATPRQARTVTMPAVAHATVLLLEDDAVVRAATRRALTEAGYEVLEASRGSEAVAHAEARHCAIDLLLSDMVMPGGSGPEVAAELLAHCPTLKVLFMSGYTDRAVLTTGMLEAGARYIQKPFDADTIVRKVREVLETLVP